LYEVKNILPATNAPICSDARQTLTAAEKTEILSDVIQKIERIYPFPEISEKITAGLKKQFQMDIMMELIPWLILQHR